MKANTVVTSSMIAKSDEKTTNDLRIQEYNMLRLSSQIAAEDYIDIRFRMPSGEDYIVVSKKKVEIPQIDGVDSATTIWLQLTEDEILTMSNAIVENYMMKDLCFIQQNMLNLEHKKKLHQHMFQVKQFRIY